MANDYEMEMDILGQHCHMYHDIEDSYADVHVEAEDGSRLVVNTQYGTFAGRPARIGGGEWDDASRDEVVGAGREFQRLRHLAEQEAKRAQAAASVQAPEAPEPPEEVRRLFLRYRSAARAWDAGDEAAWAAMREWER